MAADEILPSGIDVDGESQRASRLSRRPGPDSILPEFARGRGARERLLNVLLGLSPGQQAAQQSVALGDPFGAFVAGFGAQAAAPTAEQIAQQRRAEASKLQLQEFMAQPIEAVSPQLADKFGLHGVPLGGVQPFMGALESAAKFDELQEARTSTRPATKQDLSAIATQFGLDSERRAAFESLAERISMKDAMTLLDKSQVTGGANANVFTQQDVNALIEAEESKLGRKLNSTELTRLQGLVGVSRSLRTNVVTKAESPVSPVFAQTAAAIGVPVIDAESGQQRNATAEELSKMTAKEARAAVILSGAKTERMEIGGRLLLVSTDRRGNIIRETDLGPSKDASKLIQDSMSEFNSATSQLDIIEAAAGEVLNVPDADGPLDIGAIASRVKQSAKISVGAFARTDQAAVRYMTARETFLSGLSRASGERGVLTDQDVARIRSGLPSTWDSKNSAAAGIANMRDLFASIVQARMEMAKKLGLRNGKAMASAGFSTLDYDRLLADIRARRSGAVRSPSSQSLLPQLSAQPQSAPSVTISEDVLKKLREKAKVND